MRRKRRTRNQLVAIIRRSLAANVFLIVVLIARPGLLVSVILAVLCAAVVFAFGRLSARGAPNARSLAQRNRHLEKQLDSTRAKLEDWMARK